MINKENLIKFNQETKRLSNEDWILKAKEIHGNNFNYSKTNYINARTKLIIICPEHGEQLMYPHVHINGYGCSTCGKKMINISNGNQFTNKQFIEKVKSFNIPNISFEKTVYKTKRENVIVTCSIHGDYETKAEVLLKGCGCPKCKSSNGEKIIKDYLEKLNINFESQKQFKNLKYSRTLRFDFYLPKYNCCIEYDGEQHFKAIEYWGGEKSFKELQLKDSMKNEYCKLNNISLLRIKYSDDIVESINNFLKLVA